MAGDDSNETELQVVDEFNFDNWATEIGLTRKVTQILRQEELITKRALCLTELQDLKGLGLPLGTIKVILDEVRKFKDNSENRGDTETMEELQDNTALLEGAGKTLDLLLNQGTETKDTPPSASHGFMDPRTILTVKSQSAKAVHITLFLTEQSKRRRQAKRREFVIKTGSKDAESLVFKAEDDHPYLGIYMEEWGAANMRLLNHLLSTQQLKRNEVEYYLAYTTKIFEFAEKYEWNSVLSYDYTYRELQAEHKFKWGTFSPQMELQLLIPKRLKQGFTGANRQGFNGTKSNSSGSTEDCRLFKAKGTCPFGTSCRYRHSQNKPQSEQQEKPKNM